MKNLNRRICGLLLTVAMVLSLCCPALAAGYAFPDTEGHWAEGIIQTLTADGIIDGYGDGNCHPDAPITHGQFATLVARALKLTLKDGRADALDGLAGHWSADYVLALAEAGIIRPSDYGTAYEPDKEITRMEMVVMMVRAIGKESEVAQSQGQTKFADDGEITAADSGYINVAAEYGIIAGYPDGRVCPYQGASRAEGFCMLERMLDAHKKMQESAEGKDEDKKPEPSTGDGHSGGWSVPAPQIGFTLPETAYIGTEVAVTVSARYVSSVEWTLTKDGVSETPEGFTADGGVLAFSEVGSYTLKATAVNSRGKTAEYEQTIAVYPVVGVAFTLPVTAHTDTAIPVDLLMENAGEANAVWSVKRDGRPVELAKAASGTLDNTGGVLQFTQPGEYELTVSVEDALGTISIYTQAVTVYPVVSISIDLPDIAHTDEEVTLSISTDNLGDLPIYWTGTLNGEAINPGDYLCGGYIDMGQLSVTTPGTYTLTATITDKTGRTYTATDTMTCYPAGKVGFFLPTAFHTDDTVLVEATITKLADDDLEWTLKRDGEAVSLEEAAEGSLTENGGQIRIKEQGSYTLTASYTDGAGRFYSYEQSFIVYPIPTVEYSLPATAWTDTEIPVEVQNTGVEALTIEWMVDNTYGFQDWNTFVDGFLTNDGGTIRFKRAGTYELVARITDATGRVFLYESGIKCEVQPVLSLRIEMPELFRVDRVVDIRTGGNNNILPIDWSLEKDGQSVELSDYYDGTLNAYGGKGTFPSHGDYVLTASTTDVMGRAFSATKNLKVYPIATYAVTVPESCHIGTPFTVTGSGEYLEGCSIVWELTRSDEAAEYTGELDDDGGEIAITSAGSYMLTSIVTDQYGNVCSTENAIEITNTAPAIPVITIEPDYNDTLNTYTPECQVKVSISLKSSDVDSDVDGDAFTLEYADDSAVTGYFGAGTYTVKARSIDQWGLASEWVEQSFTISAQEPDVDLFSDTLGSNDGTNQEELDFCLEISRGGPNQIEVADYHNPDNLASISQLSVSEDGNMIHGRFAFGRHILLVKVTDVFGNTSYGARAFIISNEANQDKTSITSLSTTITEDGLYNGSDLLAYIGGFTFNIPAIPGHSTGCKDLIEIFGVTEDGTEELVLTFNTNNGYVYAHSGGTYEYTASRNNELTTAEWSGWEKQKYTKMIFHYEMTAGHESCIANATEGLSYRVRYAFIPEQIDKIEAMFSQVK